MSAIEILTSINSKMTKKQILALVQTALTDLELIDKHTVAAALGIKPNTVRQLAQKHNIGVKLPGHRVFWPSDIEKFRETGGYKVKK